jgi:hypothetical protein
LFLTIAIVSLRRRDKLKLGVAVVGGLVTIGVLLWMYVTLHADRAPRTDYWGNKYDIFFVGEGLTARLWWLGEKTYELFSFPGHLKVFWFEASYPNPYLAALQVGMCLGGLVAIAVCRKWLYALLWVSPWLVTIALNFIGKWPYGVFRTNLFLLAYSLPLGLIGLHALQQWLAGRFHRPLAGRLRGSHIVPTFCVLLALLCLPFRISYFSIKPVETLAATQSTRRAMEIIADVERHGRSPFGERTGRDLLLMDSHAYANYRFYRDVHAETKNDLGPFLEQKLRPKKGGYGPGPLLKHMEIQSRWGFWLIVSKPSLVEPAREQALRLCRVAHMYTLPEDNLVLRCLSK